MSLIQESVFKGSCIRTWQGKNYKLQYLRGVWSIFDLKGAPVLEFANLSLWRVIAPDLVWAS